MSKAVVVRNIVTLSVIHNVTHNVVHYVILGSFSGIMDDNVVHNHGENVIFNLFKELSMTLMTL